MAQWYYKGRTTTPIEHPEKGSIVLRPRQRFSAPKAAVQHLLDAGLCSRIPDPQPSTPLAAKPEKAKKEAHEVAAEPESKSSPGLAEKDEPKPVENKYAAEEVLVEIDETPVSKRKRGRRARASREES